MTAAEDFNYQMPKVVDRSLALDLASRGCREAKSMRLLFIACFTVGIILGASAEIWHIPCLSLLWAVVVSATAIGIVLAVRVNNALASRRYKKLAKILPTAMLWNSLWAPFTILQFRTCLQAQFRFLIIEGRYGELEAVSRYAWAMNERRPVSIGIPRHDVIANNLAVAFLGQGRFEEAGTIFLAVLERAKKKVIRFYVLGNLSYCMVRQHQPDAAEKYLNEAMTLVNKNATALMRMHLIRSLCHLERERLDDAEKSLTESESFAAKSKQPVELQADFAAILAEIRSKQGRHEEADLHYKNCLSILESAENPPYLKLAEYLMSYAELLEKLGRLEESHRLIHRANNMRDVFVEREAKTMVAIKQRLANPKRIMIGTQLTELACRDRLLEQRA